MHWHSQWRPCCLCLARLFFALIPECVFVGAGSLQLVYTHNAADLQMSHEDRATATPITLIPMFSYRAHYELYVMWQISWVICFPLLQQWDSVWCAKWGALLQTNLAVTAAADLLDLFLSSQGLPTSPSRCLKVWVNTPPTHTYTHSFFPHQSFPPLHFSLQKINTRLPPQVARGGAAGMERRRSVGSLIYLSLSGPGRPHRVFVCVSVLEGVAGKEVSLPPRPLGWHSGSPSLSH